MVCEDTDRTIEFFIPGDESAVVFDKDHMKLRLGRGHDDPDRAFVECEFFENHDAKIICDCVLVAACDF